MAPLSEGPALLQQEQRGGPRPAGAQWPEALTHVGTSALGGGRAGSGSQPESLQEWTPDSSSFVNGDSARHLPGLLRTQAITVLKEEAQRLPSGGHSADGSVLVLNSRSPSPPAPPARLPSHDLCSQCGVTPCSATSPASSGHRFSAHASAPSPKGAFPRHSFLP